MTTLIGPALCSQGCQDNTGYFFRPDPERTLRCVSSSHQHALGGTPRQPAEQCGAPWRMGHSPFPAPELPNAKPIVFVASHLGFSGQS